MDTFDYRELLKHYISHVSDWEGDDFLNQLFEEKFTEEEWEELQKIRDEL